MNIQVDTLEYANMLVQAGMERSHTEGVAKLQARSVKNLVDSELVTRDALEGEVGKLETKLRDEIRGTEAKLRDEIRGTEAKLRDEIRAEGAKLREEMRDMRSDIDRKLDALMMQLRALQFGGAIAAFAFSAVVLLSRLIR